MDIISQNIANAHTTHDINGQPYQRQVVVFESALQNALTGDAAGGNPPPIQAKIERDTRPPLQVYDRREYGGMVVEFLRHQNAASSDGY